jgi:hypothetical protein
VEESQGGRVVALQALERVERAVDGEEHHPVLVLVVDAAHVIDPAWVVLD